MQGARCRAARVRERRVTGWARAVHSRTLGRDRANSGFARALSRLVAVPAAEATKGGVALQAAIWVDVENLLEKQVMAPNVGRLTDDLGGPRDGHTRLTMFGTV